MNILNVFAVEDQQRTDRADQRVHPQQHQTLRDRETVLAQRRVRVQMLGQQQWAQPREDFQNAHQQNNRHARECGRRRVEVNHAEQNRHRRDRREHRARDQVAPEEFREGPKRLEFADTRERAVAQPRAADEAAEAVTQPADHQPADHRAEQQQKWVENRHEQFRQGNPRPRDGPQQQRRERPPVFLAADDLRASHGRE